MIIAKLAARNAMRRPVRTGLTLLSIAAAMFVFASLFSLDRGLGRMIAETGGDKVLVVFEKFKACPPFSRVPVHYNDKILGMEHVEDAMPVRFLLSNCQTTTDLVAVHGVEPGKFRKFREIQIGESEYAAFESERGAAIAGQAIAKKYGWKNGDLVTLKELGGVSFTLRGIFAAPGSSLENVILLDREYLEYSIDQVGVATMILVLVDSEKNAGKLGFEIDGAFANSGTQTTTGPEKAFIAGNIEDFKGLVGFAQVVGYLALVLLFAAVANSISMSVRDQMREMAIMKTLGYESPKVAAVAVLESLFVSVPAALLGFGIAYAVLLSGGFAVSVEGFTITPHLPASFLVLTAGIGAALGVAGSYLPAARGAGARIVHALKGVD